MIYLQQSPEEGQRYLQLSVLQQELQDDQRSTQSRGEPAHACRRDGDQTCSHADGQFCVPIISENSCQALR